MPTEPRVKWLAPISWEDVSNLNARRFKPGQLDIDMINVSGVVIETDPSNGGFKFQELLQGTVNFKDTGMEKDAAVAGSFDAEIIAFSGME